MEVSIFSPTPEQLPGVAWNYDELKAWLDTSLKSYRGAVYTPAMMGQAKKDRAALNKLKGALDDRRKEIKARYLEPYNTFEAQIKELIGMVAECAGAIDAQVKAEDDHYRNEKMEAIRDIYGAWAKELEGILPLEKILSPRWMNKTISLDAVEKEMQEIFARVRGGLSAIDAAGGDFVLEMRATYLETLDLSAAIARKDALAKQREAMAAAELTRHKPAAPTPAPVAAPQAEGPVHPVDFRVWATAGQLSALKQFLTDNHIKFGRVPAKEA